MTNTFGIIDISDDQNAIIRKVLHKFTEYEPEAKDPTYFQTINTEDGILTESQWEMVDEFQVPKEMRPSIMQLVRKLNKKSISSIQKPRDMARKKIIEAFITVALVLSDEEILEHFIGEVL